MSKHSHARDAWPSWKIVAVAIACALAGTVLFVATAYLPTSAASASQPAPAGSQPAPGDAPDPGRAASAIGLTSLVVLLGLLSWGVALTFLGWLGYRQYMRIPAWRRRQMFGRGR